MSLPSPQGVRLQSVSKHFGLVIAVSNISLSIPQGSYCCLLGPSGCGKTTTLRMIAGHEAVTHGDIFIGNQHVNDLPPARRNTAMMFQNYALFPHKTVWDNVDFGLKMRHVSRSERQSRVGDILELVGLSAMSRRQPHQLSGGQQQRVALARALVTRPQVLLLDEPLSALDESMRSRMRGELRKLQRQFGITFIQVTHVQEEAFALADLIVVMDQGHIDQVGSAQAIFAAPASQFVAQFVGDNNIFSGRVIKVSPWIQLEVDHGGTFLCRGESAEIGNQAACTVRADQLKLSTDLSSTDSPNRLTARISFIEFTGYLVRVTLTAEASGQELLYKARTYDFMRQGWTEGQVVQLSWDPEDCIFLPK